MCATHRFPQRIDDMIKKKRISTGRLPVYIIHHETSTLMKTFFWSVCHPIYSFNHLSILRKSAINRMKFPSRETCYFWLPVNFDPLRNCKCLQLDFFFSSINKYGYYISLETYPIQYQPMSLLVLPRINFA